MPVVVDELNNPLGFSRETATLVTGLGCSNLTKFKEKNISIDDLKYLTPEDLAILGKLHDNLCINSCLRFKTAKNCILQSIPRILSITSPTRD